MEKIDVNGDDRHPIYAELTEKAGRRGQGGRHHVELREVPRVARRATIVARYRPQVEPEDPAIVGDIEAQLAA